MNCPNCGHSNSDQALVCVGCYAIFKKFDVNLPSTTVGSITTFDVGPIVVTSRREHSALAKLDHGFVGLFIGELSDPVVLHVIESAFLGRKSAAVKVHPLLDLDAFDGFNKGVSRLHASIHWTRTGMALQDLNSSNGTWLNNIRLEPRRYVELHSGDIIMLGRLPIEAFVGTQNMRDWSFSDQPPGATPQASSTGASSETRLLGSGEPPRSDETAKLPDEK